MHIGLKVFHILARARFKVLHILPKFFFSVIKLLLHRLLVAVPEINILLILVTLWRDLHITLQINLLIFPLAI